ncbi:MAG: hypothetical protein ACXVCY_04170 [Pseudobdellovibrionaceae bacterium]
MEIKENEKVISLSQDDIKMFEVLIRMEIVHNTLGQYLGEFKDQIMDLRNQVVANTSQKYRLEKPKEWMYDPLRQKLVSVYNPNISIYRSPETSGVFQDAARSELSDVISKLSKIIKAMKI